MKIGIIGAGKAGSSLGKALLKAGHEVMFSSRDPQGEPMQKLRAETGAPVGSVAETLAYSPVIAIAMAPNVIGGIIQEHADAWSDKIIIDMNNKGGLELPTSFGQYLASITHGRVVKAFNTIGVEHLENPVFDGQKATMLIASDDAEAKGIVSGLAADLGFEPVDAGGLEMSGLLENLAMLWVRLASTAGYGRDFAFRIIRK
jgi:predicted dinucleotide-binding enzyme